ncbi:helix-turn-helix domain-containing protein [Niabella drilacis]|uniref:AraC-type DNA-binding protein n=1 Tax=Niabella drilacis (strain DSM 25811 / CCM 8410 / CCUG 62505 / LMG 26954 / E90) TaxID=1285928 RepID=A0A1G6KTS4_NIADE|nr:helix-turn-helix domain-containing protein [Niabella drilacis]SDC34181.1 AraC-type DNA-binding protein [Niabella drilacis]
MQVFNFLLSAIAFLLLAFACHLLYARQGNLLLNRLLSVPLLMRFGQICIFLLIVSGYNHVYPFFQVVFTPLFFVAPACSWLYVRCFVRAQNKLKKSDAIHFIPFLLALIHLLLPVKFVNWHIVSDEIIAGGHFSVTESTGFFPAAFYSYGLAVLVAGYLIASWYIVSSSGIIRKSKWNAHKRWLFFYLSSSSFFKLLGFAAVLLKIRGIAYVNNPVFLIISCLVLLFMMTFVLYQPGILYGYILINKKIGTTKEPIEVEVSVSKKIAAPAAKLSIANQATHADAIARLMEVEQPFLSADYQIIHLAQTLQIPVHHCSQTINQHFGRNFRDWLNGYRVRHFIELYRLANDQITIEAAAFQSGFRNITTFYNAFKKETGHMPKTYFEHILAE